MPIPRPPRPPRPGGATTSGSAGRPVDAAGVARRDHQVDEQQRLYDRKFNPSQGKNTSLRGGGGFNKSAAGSKTYGMGRAAPNMGKTTNKAGYGRRDAMNARANAIQKRLGGM